MFSKIKLSRDKQFAPKQFSNKLNSKNDKIEEEIWMRRILSHLDEKYKIKDVSKINLEKGNICVSPKHDLMGVIVNDECLLLHHKYFYSFRLKINNLGFIKPFYIFGNKLSSSEDKNYLENYFKENMDNPYGIYNVMRYQARLQPIDNLTQFPPLFLKKDEQKQIEDVNKLKELARVGDSIYTFNRESGLSRMIRKVDRGMWSHVAMVDEDKNIYELTTSGMRTSDFSSLYNPMLDIGLYRLRIESKDEKEHEEFSRKIMIESKQLHKLHRTRYSWFKVFLIYLKRKTELRIPIPSPADLMYMNILDLKAYA